MKIVSHLSTSAVKESIVAQTPIKACMHVRGAALTDGRVMREASALREAGFAVSIVDIEHELIRPLEEEISGITVKHIFQFSSFISQYFKLWPFIKTMQSHIYSAYRLLHETADIYHAHDVRALPACYVAARLRRKPLILDAHELPLSELEGTRWRMFRNLFTHFLTDIVPQCAGVITVSHPIAQEIRMHFHPQKVVVVRNIPFYQRPLQNDQLRKYLGLNLEVRIALYQGNLQPDRGLDRLIHAAAFLERNIVIVLMGKGVGATQSQLEALIASEGVADRIKIIPPVPYVELLQWTASADIGLIVYSPDQSLNVQMCLPNKLFEYLMAGLPVLASPLEAVVDVLKIYDVGRVVRSLIPEEIATAVNRMLADRAALDRMRCNALNAAQNDLCWEEERWQLIRLYHNILGMANETTSNQCSARSI